MRQVGFIGLGLIGGSIAKNIRRLFPRTVLVAYDVDRGALRQAVEDHVVDQAADAIDGSFAACELIFLCAPVHFNMDALHALKSIIDPSCIVTDVGSVKTDICRAAVKEGMSRCFIGGHPMVGSEKSGYRHASDRLIEQAYYFLTPFPETDREKLERLNDYIGRLGAIPILFDWEQHDRAAASISHIPHIIASGLVNLVRAHDDENGILKQLAAGGFKDITRIASSSPVVWQHICLSNPENIQLQLEDFIHELERLKTAIQQKDADYLHDYFQRACDYRDSIPNQAVGVISKVFESYANIPDLPGELAKVTTLMADHAISLSNIGIVSNRLYEEGALRIVFHDGASCRKARQVLAEAGYELYPEK